MKVTCPNPRLTQKEALKSLHEHPQFPKNARVVEIKKVKGRWEAELDVPKEASTKQSAPPFLPGGPSEPSEGPPKDEDSPKPPEIDTPDLDDDDDDNDSDSDSKPDLGDVLDLVKQIADKVGVKPKGEESDELGEKLEDEIPPKPPGGPGPGPSGPKPPPARPGLRPGMAPPGTTPVGAPAFASVLKEKKIATFEVSDITDVPLSEAERQINDKYAEYSYKVKKLVEGTDKDGKRIVRAQVSCR